MSEDVPTFDELLADPNEQFDVNSELLPNVLAELSCWCGEQHARWSSMEIALCDPDGVVRRGAMHRGQDYECTGSAHWSGLHIRCTSPAHVERSR